MNRLILTFLSATIFTNIIAQDISQWRGTNRDGIYNETGLLKKWPESGPKLLWHFDELDEGHTSAAVTSTGIFTTGMIDGKGFIFAFSRDNQTLKLFDAVGINKIVEIFLKSLGL